MKKPPPPGHRRRALVEELEARVLMSADAGGLLVDPSLVENFSADPLAHRQLLDVDSAVRESVTELRRELVFVDPAVEGHEQLVEDLRSRDGGGRALEVVLLDRERDGIDQITAALEEREGLDALHIVSHATDGAVQLGGAWLDTDSLASRGGAIASWGDALTSEGDLLFYGCDLASSDEGVALVDTLGRMTGADVAASTDTTGAAALGGDWDLEHTSGSIESAVAVSAQAQASFQGVLGWEYVRDEFDTVSYSGNDGSMSWSGPWAGADAGGGGAAGGNMSVTGNQLQVLASQAGDNLAREADLSGAATAWLYLEVDNQLTGTDHVQLEISDDGGGSWSVLEDYTAAGDETGAFDISGFAASNTQIRVSVVDGSNGSAIRFDDITINFGDTATGPGTAIFTHGNTGVPQQSGFDGTSFGVPVGTLDIDGPWEVIQGAEAPTRNEAIVVGADPDGNLSGMIWNGSQWTALPFNDFATVSNSEGWTFDIAYESQSGNAMLVYGDTSGGNELEYRIWDGSSWSGPFGGPITGEITHIELASNPNADEIVMVAGSNTFETGASVWNGTTWSSPITLHDGTGAVGVTDISVAYEQTTGDALVVYGTGTSDVTSRIWTGSSWQPPRTISAPAGVTGQVRWTTVGSDPNSERIALGVITEDREVWLAVWDQNNWDTAILATPDSPHKDRLAVGVAFESQSGEALAAYATSADQVSYRTWTVGGGWSGAQVGPDLGHHADVITLDSDPNSNRVMLSVSDQDKDLSYVAWDGSAWGTTHELELDAGTNRAQPFLFLWNQGSAAANTPPTISVTGAASVDEDSPFTLNLSAVDPDGDTITSWTIDWGDGTIETILGNPPTATHVYASGGFTYNITVSVTDSTGAVTTPGAVFLSSGTTDSVFRFDATTGGLLQEFADLDGIDSPVDVQIGPDGLIYVTGFATDDVRRYDATTGAFVDVFVSTGSGGLNGPSRMVWGPDANLYVTSLNSWEVLRYDGATGNFIDVFVTWSGSPLGQPDGIAFGPDGNLYVASDQNSQILRYDGATGAYIDVFANYLGWSYTDLAFGPDGDLYVSTVGRNAVEQFDGVTGARIGDFVTPGSGGIDGAGGIEFGPDNLLYLVGWQSNNVLRYSATDGSFVDEYISSAAGASQPVNLAFAPAHQVLVLHRADVPSVTGTVTLEDTQSTSGLVIDRNASDGAEVTHFQITNITNGTLYHNDGTTVIAEGDFITFAEGNLGLKFTPSPDYSGPASFDVKASTTGDATDLSAAATASITVNPVNDQPSVSGGPFSLAENSPNTTVVGSVSGSDPDVGDTLSYAIVGGNPGNAFAIDAATGEITVNNSAALDFETTPVFALQVEVSDDGTPGLASTATVTINLSNVNETPSVSGGPFALAENAASTTVVGSVTGSDPDVGDTLSYAIVGGNPGNAFAIDAATGEITVNNSAALDFETTPVFALQVEVSDDGTPGLASTATVTINLSNVNETPSVSGGPFALAENAANATVVGSVTGSDPDAGDTLSYTIVGGNPGNAFAIDATTGEITVNNSAALDFETTPVFALQVEVSDDGTPGLASTATVTINLSNVNETPSVSGGPFAIAENAANATVVGSVTGSDPDAGDTLSYTIVGGNPGNAFAIDSVTGEITVNNSAALDFETTPVFALQVEVSDDGTPGLASTATVTINLSNVNETPSVSGGPFALAENAANATVVGSVTGSDPDVGDTLSYAIVGGNPGNAFAIDAATGEITVNNSAALDFETTPVFALQVEVSDDGTPGLASTATVTINLSNVNETPSVSGGPFAIAENAANATVVGSVTGSDPDAGDTLSYAIVGGNPGNAFAIDAATGEITVNNSAALDFETTPVFALQVEVSDDGTPGLASTATVTINLSNVNETPSVSGGPFALAENAANATVVGSVTGSDPDAGDTLSYAIVGGNPGNAFAIDSVTGEITVNNSAALDFGTLPVYSLQVEVSDDGIPGLSSTAIVAIDLIETNQAPSVSGGPFSLPENAASTTVVGSVTGSDPDVGDSLRYAIIGGNRGNAFAIDAATGEITVNNSAALDFETTPVFALQVEVSDDGTPGLTSTATVTVNLSNVNEAPSVSGGPFTLSTNAADAMRVGGVTASDPDVGDTLRYAIIGGNPGNAFAIDSVTGEITVNNSAALDFETTPVFALQVQVSDDGAPGASTTATVTVSLTPNFGLPRVEDPVAPPEDASEPPATENDSAPEEVPAPPPAAVTPDLPESDPRGGSAPGIESFSVVTGPATEPERSVARGVALDAETIERDHRDRTNAERQAEQDAQVPLARRVFANLRSDFIEELNRVRGDVDLQEQNEQKLAGSSTGLAAGLSVGYALLLTRGGLLLSSLISSLPAWRLIDPLPILASLGSRDADGDPDDESLDSLVSHGAEATDEASDAPVHSPDRETDTSVTADAHGPAGPERE